MSPPTTRPMKRVLVAMGPAAESRAALEAAARIAAESEAELVGLFVEESDLLEAASLPLTRVVRSSDFTLATLDRSTMEQGLRVWAAQARATFASVAERWNLRTSFRVVRGSVSEMLLAETRACDLVALGTVSRPSLRRRLGSTARLLARRASCSVLLSRGGQASLPILVLYEGNDDTLAMGESLARLNAVPLRVLVGDDDLARRAKTWLAESGRDLSPEPLDSAAPHDVAAALAGEAVGIVVLDRKGEIGGRVDAATVLAGPAHSLIVMG